MIEEREARRAAKFERIQKLKEEEGQISSDEDEDSGESSSEEDLVNEDWEDRKAAYYKHYRGNDGRPPRGRGGRGRGPPRHHKILEFSDEGE